MNHTDPKFKIGDKVLYQGIVCEIESIFTRHEKGLLYTLVGWPNFAALESLLTLIKE